MRSNTGAGVAMRKLRGRLSRCEMKQVLRWTVINHNGPETLYRHRFGDLLRVNCRTLQQVGVRTKEPLNWTNGLDLILF